LSRIGAAHAAAQAEVKLSWTIARVVCSRLLFIF
jgi:hypothetical protein